MNTTELMLIVASVLCVAAVVLFAVDYFRERKGKDTTDIDRAKEIVLKLMSKVGLYLFTEAEKTYGGGTGQLKMSAVIAQLVTMLPDSVAKSIDTEWLTEKAEYFLKIAKEQWTENAKLLDNEKE